MKNKYQRFIKEDQKKNFSRNYVIIMRMKEVSFEGFESLHDAQILDADQNLQCHANYTFNVINASIINTQKQ